MMPCYCPHKLTVCKCHVPLQGIEVCLVSPGAVRTPIWSKSGNAATALMAGAPAEAEAMYGRLIRQVS